MLRGILGPIPNLQVGYLYSFGPSVSSGRLTLDYLLPVNLSADSTIFGEAHSEFQNFWKTFTGSANHRVDLSFGAGYRRILGKHTLLGINGFYDTTRLGGIWYSSGSLGLEMAAILPGNDAVDLSFNWYGNLFNGSVLANVFRRGPQNFDCQAGYSHELWEGGPDLRLYAAGYRFSADYEVYGGRAGAELKTRDGMFVAKYEVARDPVNRTYHTVGGYVNVGLRLSNLLSGENPFEMPEPIFRSPRNLRRLIASTVKRHWTQSAVVSSTRTTWRGHLVKIDGRWYCGGGASRVRMPVPPLPRLPPGPTPVRVRAEWSGFQGGSSGFTTYHFTLVGSNDRRLRHVAIPLTSTNGSADCGTYLTSRDWNAGRFVGTVRMSCSRTGPFGPDTEWVDFATGGYIIFWLE